MKLTRPDRVTQFNRTLLLLLPAATAAAVAQGVSSFQTQFDLTLGGDANEVLVALLPTADGGMLLAGNSNSDVSGTKETGCWGDYDIWLVRLDGQGRKLWEQVYGGDGADTVQVVIPRKEGGYLVGGVSESGVTGTKTTERFGGKDYWLLETDDDGNVVRENAYGTRGDEIGRASCRERV